MMNSSGRRLYPATGNLKSSIEPAVESNSCDESGCGIASFSPSSVGAYAYGLASGSSWTGV